MEKRIYNIEDRRIVTYDNLLSYNFRQTAYEFAKNSLFKLGWNDTGTIENSPFKLLHSEYSESDLKTFGLMTQLENTEIYDILKNYKVSRCVLNLSTPDDSNFCHTHSDDFVLLYYVNLEWKNEWYGETIFYDELTENIELAIPYKPGRITLFEGKIPHSIRPQSRIAPFYRFTLSIFFKK